MTLLVNDCTNSLSRAFKSCEGLRLGTGRRVIAAGCDVEIRAGMSAYADRAQEIHIKVIHALIHCLEEALR